MKGLAHRLEPMGIGRRPNRPLRGVLAAQVLLALLLALGAAAPAEAGKGQPRLIKAGIACGKNSADTGKTCILYVRAQSANQVKFSFRNVKNQEAFHMGRDVFSAWRFFSNPVRKECLVVRAEASSKRGVDRGRVRLCDVGNGLENVSEGAGWTVAKYKRF